MSNYIEKCNGHQQNPGFRYSAVPVPDAQHHGRLHWVAHRRRGERDAGERADVRELRQPARVIRWRDALPAKPGEKAGDKRWSKLLETHWF